MGKFKLFLKTKKGIACIIAAAIIILAAVGFGGYEIWHYNQPKFHDVTVELGVDSVKLSQFMTEYARARKVSFVSDVSEVDLNNAGVTELTLAHGNKQETVTLTVQDTTAPAAEFVTEMTVPADYVFDTADFVTNIEDFSDTTVSFGQEPEIPADYSDLAIEVIVSDEHGNATKGQCTVSFVWLRDSFVLEYGEEITKDDILIDPAKDSQRVKQSDLDTINAGGVGEYSVTSKIGEKALACSVTVQDTKGPELVLNELQLYIGAKTTVDAFVFSCEDISGETTVSLVSEIDYDIRGKQTVSVKAVDIYGNETVKETYLWISNDHTAPYFYGLDTMYPDKYTEPDYTAGVTAYDNMDGEISFTFDASNVNTAVAGTYYVTYTAQDASGNVYTQKRRVDVPHDQADTDAMVTEIASGLSDDVEEIVEFVREYVYYSYSWGDDDPVWYGFTNRNGNCYVHAMCLHELLTEKGYETQIIWVTNKSHYWNIVKIDGKWWHIDSTPGQLHSLYSIMNDQQRLSTLSGRIWDTSLWPACG